MSWRRVRKWPLPEERGVSGFEGDTDRKLIPRWRFSRDYGGSAEFHGDPRRRKQFKPELAYLDERLACWSSSRNIATAADAVACGLTYDLHGAVREPAEYLLEQGDRAMPGVVRMAEAVLQSGTAPDDNQSSLPLASTVAPKSQATAMIREKRAQLRRYPRSSLAHIDMARGYAILGQTRQATDSLRQALCLSPDHRIALRLASRFLVHADEAERAHDLLRKHPRTKTDPWLLAAEIAIAAVAGRESSLMKRGLEMLKQGSLPPEHLTELQSAVATQLLADGRTKVARQTFANSLERPTENTVAQAHWARRHLASLAVSEKHLSIHRGFEARSWRAMEMGEWQSARSEVTHWQLDEPFSSRPASLGSYLGITLLGDYDFALECADIGLMAEPEDSTLLNNKAVALAYNGEISDAITTFNSISSIGGPSHPQYVHTATAGLLNFRAGFVDEGREHYRRARDLAPAKSKGRVLLHWAGEEIRLQSDDAPELRKMALEYLEKDKTPGKEQMERVLLNPAIQTSPISIDSADNRLPTIYIPTID